MSDYVPIACAAYDVLEIAIMRAQRLRIHRRDDAGAVCEQVLRPLSLRIIDRAEYLVARASDGAEILLRLDRIETAEPLE